MTHTCTGTRYLFSVPYGRCRPPRLSWCCGCPSVSSHRHGNELRRWCYGNNSTACEQSTKRKSSIYGQNSQTIAPLQIDTHWRIGWSLVVIDHDAAVPRTSRSVFHQVYIDTFLSDAPTFCVEDDTLVKPQPLKSKQTEIKSIDRSPFSQTPISSAPC